MTTDVVDEAIVAFEKRKREMTHHSSCTTAETPQRTDDWSLVDCPTCLENNPAKPLDEISASDKAAFTKRMKRRHAP